MSLRAILGDWEHQAFSKPFESSEDYISYHCGGAQSHWNLWVISTTRQNTGFLKVNIAMTEHHLLLSSRLLLDTGSVEGILLQAPMSISPLTKIPTRYISDTFVLFDLTQTPQVLKLL